MTLNKPLKTIFEWGAKVLVKGGHEIRLIISVTSYADGKMIAESNCPRLEDNIMVQAVLWQAFIADVVWL